ncbi:MAG: hypothetical protein LBD77_00160 [Bifidobacteriaceae bacterium]|nr:hypothetical protein [Bifidobacteriaceae bacterium]
MTLTRPRQLVTMLIAALTLSALVVLGSPVAGAEGATSGTYPTRKGVIMVGTDPSWSTFGIGLGFGHAAIVYDADYVVEANFDGVIKGKNNWYSARTKVTGLDVIAATPAQEAAAAEWTYTQIGKPFNYNVFNTSLRSRYYCAHLVWAAFKDKYGIDLNTSAWDILGAKAVAPTELISTPKTTTIYTQS